MNWVLSAEEREYWEGIGPLSSEEEGEKGQSKEEKKKKRKKKKKKKKKKRKEKKGQTRPPIGSSATFSVGLSCPNLTGALQLGCSVGKFRTGTDG